MQRMHQEFRMYREFQSETFASVRTRATARLMLRRARALCAPEHLLLGAVLVFGWAALIAWTGNGAVGWQARLCADAEATLAACRASASASDGKVL